MATAYIARHEGRLFELNIVIVCCSVLQCVAVCCSVLQCGVLRPVLQCVAVCCSVLLCVAVCFSVLQRVAACCSVLQYVAVCCSMLLKGECMYHKSLKHTSFVCHELDHVYVCV